MIGSILLCALAIIVSVLLLLRSQRKRAAVGRRLVLNARSCGIPGAGCGRETRINEAGLGNAGKCKYS